MDADQILRQQLLVTLAGKGAHMTFEDAIANFPMELINEIPAGALYSSWHLLEHIRLCQWDILEYAVNPDHVSPEWPKGYWPEPGATADATAWEKTIEGFRADMRKLEELVKDPATDLYSPIPHGYGGHTILREILLVADHNAYHVGELAAFREILGGFPKDR